MLTPLNLPKANLKLTRRNDTLYVFDIFRKKELILTPEEWVRQHFLHFLVTEKKTPLGLISSEHALTINGLKRRCDAVVFNKMGKPILIVECKAPSIKLSEKTLHQIAQYNFKLKVNWLVLTNGIQTITCHINHSNKQINYSEEVPFFEEMITI